MNQHRGSSESGGANGKEFFYGDQQAPKTPFQKTVDRYKNWAYAAIIAVGGVALVSHGVDSYEHGSALVQTMDDKIESFEGELEKFWALQGDTPLTLEENVKMDKVLNKIEWLKNLRKYPAALTVDMATSRRMDLEHEVHQADLVGLEMNELIAAATERMGTSAEHPENKKVDEERRVSLKGD